MLLPFTAVSPMVNDWARLSMLGLTVVSTFPVVPKAAGFWSRDAM